MKNFKNTKISQFILGFFAITVFFVNTNYSLASGWVQNPDGSTYYSGGNVGISTTNPQATLTVNGNRLLLGGEKIDGIYNSKDSVFEIQSYSGSSYLNMKSAKANFVISANEFGDGEVGFYGAGYPFVFYTSAIGAPVTQRMKITTDGKVGIGTANPSATLEVAGNTKISGGLSWANGKSTLGTDGGSIEIGDSTGNTGIYFDMHYGIGKAEDFNIRLENPADNRFIIAGSKSSTPYLVVDKGWVGVGIDYPQTALDVNGSIKLKGNIVSDTDICIGKC